MSKSKQVLELTNKGLKAGDIAKKLKTSVAYVYFVRSTAKKKIKTQPERSHDPKVVKAEKKYLKKVKAVYKSPRSRLVNDLFEMRKAMDAIESKPTKLFVQPQYKDAAMKILADNDLVNHPPHYTKGGIEYWDFAEAKGLTENAYLFNAGKYIVRCGKKEGADPIQDLEKAIKFIQRDIDRRKRA